MPKSRLCYNQNVSRRKVYPSCEGSEEGLNRRLSQMRATLAACREPAGSYNRLSEVLYVYFLTYNAISFNPCSIYPHWDILTYQ